MDWRWRFDTRCAADRLILSLRFHRWGHILQHLKVSFCQGANTSSITICCPPFLTTEPFKDCAASIFFSWFNCMAELFWGQPTKFQQVSVVSPAMLVLLKFVSVAVSPPRPLRPPPQAPSLKPPLPTDFLEQFGFEQLQKTQYLQT